MREAEFIAALRHMLLHEGAGELLDDTAKIGGLTISTDTIVEGLHFLADDPPDAVAWKLVAVALSDLAAKGAEVEGILLNYPLSTDAWDHAFLLGLEETLQTLGVPLLGGDTVSLPLGAPRILTVTAIGSDAAAPPRRGARAGDGLWVTGTIGDAGAGLAIARGRPGPIELRNAYRGPTPMLVEGRALAPLVHAMMDVSDGLLIDAARMALASDLAVTIDLAAVPLSSHYRAFAGDDRAARIAAATAGDDYQLLFAAPPDFIPPALEARGFMPPTRMTRVGSFTPGSGLTLTDGADPVPLPSTLGFQH